MQHNSFAYVSEWEVREWQAIEIGRKKRPKENKPFVPRTPRAWFKPFYSLYVVIRKVLNKELDFFSAPTENGKKVLTDGC